VELGEQAKAIADSRGGLVARAALAAAGLDVRRLGTCPGLHRVVRGVWATAPLPPWPRFVVRDGSVDPAYAVRVAAALLALGPRATARARTAAVLHG
jgi:hypothetical protein